MVRKKQYRFLNLISGDIRFPMFPKIMLFGRTRCFVFLLAMASGASIFLLISSPEKADPPPLHTFVTHKIPHHSSILEEEIIRKPEPQSDPLYSLLPPPNSTPGDRMAWMRHNVGQFQIFKSDNLTVEFNTRVLDFFSRNKCSVRFFMTWIAAESDFGEQQLLGIDSLFKSNPNSCLVIVSKTMEESELLQPYVHRGFKVTAITPDLSFLFKKTKAHRWFEQLKNGTIDPGEIPLPQNLSNLMRIAVLYKYGGVYIDTDFIVLKDFRRLKNSIGAQSSDLLSGNWTRINNAVMIFDRHHWILNMFMEEFADTFNGSRWGHNGPYMVSRVVERVQGEGYGGNLDLTVLPPVAFYPVGWTRIGGLFEAPTTRSGKKWVEAKAAQLKQRSYGVHLWNKKSRGIEIEEGSVMDRLTSEQCVVCKRRRRHPLF